MQVHLDTARRDSEIARLLKSHTEVAINLDQDPLIQPHMGSHMPVQLASQSCMYAILRDRPFTCLESWSTFWFFLLLPTVLIAAEAFPLLTLPCSLFSWPTAAQELACAQMIPVYPSCWKALGFSNRPVSFEGVPPQAIRRMSGNTFHQSCFVAWQAFLLMRLQRRE